MSNLPPGVSQTDPHFGPIAEIETKWPCWQCGWMEADVTVEVFASGFVWFYHKTPEGHDHSDDITDKWFGEESV